MARSKQATPIRREASTEYFSKRDVPKRTVSGETTAQSNGNLKTAVPVAVPTTASAAAKVSEAGALQILIAVGGIYASLYVIRSSLRLVSKHSS